MRTKKQDRDPNTGRLFIESVDDIPSFTSDEEEAAFWETHEPPSHLVGSKRVTLEELLAEARSRKQDAKG